MIYTARVHMGPGVTPGEGIGTSIGPITVDAENPRKALSKLLDHWLRGREDLDGNDCIVLTLRKFEADLT